MKKEKYIVYGFPFIAAGITAIIFLITAFKQIGIWPLGDRTLLICDSIHQYLPFYTELQRKLSGGESLFYSFSGGFGYNLWVTIAYYMSSPLNVILRFVPTENVCDFLDIMFLIKSAMASGFFTYYMSYKTDKNMISVPFGVAYGMSNYIIGYYYNIMWLDSIAFLPLVMMGIEKGVKDKDYRLYCFSLFMSIWCNFYIGLIICIFSCIWFIVQCVSYYKDHDFSFAGRAFGFGFNSLIAGGMTGILLIPAWNALKSAGETSANGIPTGTNMNIIDVIKNMYIVTDPVTVTDTQKGLNIYCGSIILMGMILFVIDRSEKIRYRIGICIVLGIIISGFCLKSINYILHGFHLQSGIPNRFSFLFIAVALSSTCTAIYHIKGIPYKNIIISWATVCAGTFIMCFWAKEISSEQLKYTCIILSILTILFVLWKRYHAKKSLAAVFCFIICLSLVFETYMNAQKCFKANEGVDRDFYINDQKSFRAMMAQYPSREFFRSEIDRQHMRNMAVYSGGNGIVLFNSMMQGSVVDFCKAIGLEARRNKNGYYGTTKLTNSLFGIKYIASPERKADQFNGFPKIMGYDNLDLYENKDALSIGFMVDSDIKEWDTEAKSAFEVQNDFCNLAAKHDDIFKKEYSFTTYSGDSNNITLAPGKQTYFKSDRNVRKIQVSTPEYDRTVNDYNDFIFTANAIGNDDIATLKITSDNKNDFVNVDVYSCEEKDYKSVIDTLKRNQLENVEVIGNKVKGNLQNTMTGTMLLTIPYDKGWTVKVDGKEISPYKIGNCFIGFDLSAGYHEISMKYIPCGLKKGVFVSLFSFWIFLISSSYRKFRKKW